MMTAAIRGVAAVAHLDATVPRGADPAQLALNLLLVLPSRRSYSLLLRGIVFETGLSGGARSRLLYFRRFTYLFRCSLGTLNKNRPHPLTSGLSADVFGCPSEDFQLARTSAEVVQFA